MDIWLGLERRQDHFHPAIGFTTQEAATAWLEGTDDPQSRMVTFPITIHPEWPPGSGTADPNDPLTIGGMLANKAGTRIKG